MITDFEIQEIIRLHQSGYTGKQISKEIEKAIVENKARVIIK